MLKVFLILFLSSIFSNASEKIKIKEMKLKVEKFIKKKNKSGHILKLNKDDMELIVSCPIGLKCPSSSYNLALKGKSESKGTSLYLSFNISDLNLDLNNLVNHFSYIYYNIDFSNELNIDGWKLSNSQRGHLLRKEKFNAGNKIEFLSYTNGLLKGKLTHLITYMNVTSDDFYKRKSKCGIRDAPLPEGCSYSFKSNIKLILNFEIPIVKEYIGYSDKFYIKNEIKSLCNILKKIEKETPVIASEALISFIEKDIKTSFMKTMFTGIAQADKESTKRILRTGFYGANELNLKKSVYSECVIDNLSKRKD